jgi:hypothetical protein
MYGMRVNKKIIEGKMARKKLKARDVALIFIEPFFMALKKNFDTTYRDWPSNPGITIFLVPLTSE